MFGKKTILVTGASGMQSRPIVAALKGRGLKVKALSRSKETDLGSDVEQALGDLGDYDSLNAAMAGCDLAVLMLPLIFDRHAASRYVANTLRAAKAQGVKHIVFNASAPVPDSEVGVAAVDVKVDAVRQLQAQDVPYSVVSPTIYLGNLAAPWTAPGIVNDATIAYPLATEVPCSWISWEDSAAQIAAIAHREKGNGTLFRLGGPAPLDGHALADAFATARGGSHTYVAVPIPGFRDGLNAALGEPVGTEIGRLYEFLSGDGAPLLSTDGQTVAKRLGGTLTSVDTWIKNVPWEVIT